MRKWVESKMLFYSKMREKVYDFTIQTKVMTKGNDYFEDNNVKSLMKRNKNCFYEVIFCFGKRNAYVYKEKGNGLLIDCVVG